MLASDQKMNPNGLSATSKQVLAMRDAVFAEWERQVRLLIKGAQHVLHPILLNTLPIFYDNIAEALTPNHPRSNGTSNNDVAAAHGNERARMTSYEPEQIVHEYQLFRDAFSQVADERGVTLTRTEWGIVNNSIDLAVRESIKKFTSMHDSFRQKMAASLSHDMRTPLSVMVNAAHILTLAASPQKTPEMAKRILHNGQRLSAMIDELLDALSFNRSEALPLDLSEFDVLPLAQSVCADASLNDTAECTVSGGSVVGYWCENSLRRALENLVINGIKYGDGKGVQVKIDEAHGRLLISVHNTGTPIAPEHHGQIFEYLWRDGSVADKSGWGMGLPFVKSVAESHGGSVAVDSSAASGTTFIIDIPVDCRPFVEQAASAVSP
ncbi:signal transduction histidine kinase [Duganella sp. SG902]|uniref:sensor histidine kinase n=1 Tax=Duganella sp. SG902 TaxID=2587016 RepID=UPI00159E10D6|nr:HAMP domain-containing sensor histidine kinase [Duganella sp. SG902]NVM74849.1 signal transduction histidine kinase [Duganella sp. SG902]